MPDRESLWGADTGTSLSPWAKGVGILNCHFQDDLLPLCNSHKSPVEMQLPLSSSSAFPLCCLGFLHLPVLFFLLSICMTQIHMALTEYHLPAALQKADAFLKTCHLLFLPTLNYGCLRPSWGGLTRCCVLVSAAVSLHKSYPASASEMAWTPGCVCSDCGPVTNM